MKKHNLLGSMRKTVEAHHMLQENDQVAVGLSGGKDSMALLHALARFQTFSNKPFDLCAITIDLGFNNMDLSTAKDFCASLQIPYHIVTTDIASVVFDIRKEKNACALCANMRRGALAKKMNQEGFKILALGHHAMDQLETFWLNFLYSGNMNRLSYLSYLDRSDITVIRPFLETSEETIQHYVRTHQIPVIKNPCPMDNHSKRYNVHQLIKQISQQVPPAYKSMMTAVLKKDPPHKM